MSLVNCPECGHDVSAAAVACPNCGRPLQNRTVPPARPVVVDAGPKESGLPPWAFVAFGVAAILLLFFVFFLVSRDSDGLSDNTNVRVCAEADRRSGDARRSTAEDYPSSTTTVPPTEGETVPSDVPGIESTVPGSQTRVPANPTKGVVKIDAKVITQNGSPQAVRNEKFYLLERDIEMILSDAGLEPIEGNTLSNSLGLAITFPDRYPDFRSDALSAINKYIEYSGTTDASGKAELSGVNPGSYYLFGITKTPNGFALWSAPVSVIAGENVLNLAPQRISEVDRASE
ncbi:MAG: zinc ribbon domain-containing protein [Pyrinomonadaceae bacterium]|nr:zinc ribbon domain-containing protein [Pyrinomonadaceae bacterium]